MVECPVRFAVQNMFSGRYGVGITGLASDQIVLLEGVVLDLVLGLTFLF